MLIVSEVSPYAFHNYVLQMFPFLVNSVGKGTLLVILATFCFGDQMNAVGILTGILTMAAGGFCIAKHILDPSPYPDQEVRFTYYEDFS